MTLNLAVDYGARTELCDAAVRSWRADVAAGRLEPEAIDDEAIAGKLIDGGDCRIPIC